MEDAGLLPPAEFEAAEEERFQEEYDEWLKGLPYPERAERELEDRLRSIKSSVKEEIRKAAIEVE